MRRFSFGLAFLVAAAFLVSCNGKEPSVNRVGVNVVDKSVFTGSWYYSRTVIDVDYEAAGLGTYPGDAAIDFAGSALGTLPRVRWVIDENYLFAYRDYELLEYDGRRDEAPDDLGHPVAAFNIESHFDIKRAYNPNTGEQRNVVEENTSDRRWYEREFMRVDWSKNQLPAYYGQVANLYAILGFYNREPADLYIQGQSDFPDSWKPQFHFMGCDGEGDESEECTDHDRDWASDYDKGDLYHFSFVTQELMSPGQVPDPFNPFALTEWCTSEIYIDAPTCTSHAVYIRNSFLKQSDQREYEPTNWVDSRFGRHGYFRLEQDTYDGSSGAGDPQLGATDFLNYNVNRHNIWMDWVDDETGEPIPYSDREVREIVWYTTHELPAHLVRPSFDLVSEWNGVMMGTVRNLRGEPDADYPEVECQDEDPDAYCYCHEDPETGEVLTPTCAGKYDPFTTPEEAEAAGATNPYDCWVEVPDGAEPDMNDPALTDEDFYGWYGAEMRGSECVTELRINTCNRRSIAENDGTRAGLACEERGDARFKFLSYVDQPGTAFLGVATLRGDPVTGEIMVGDANIGGPALDGYRTFALQTYDVMNGDLTEFEVLTGEDVRQALESLDNVQLPNPPRIDFNVALKKGATSVSNPVKRSVDTKMERYWNRAKRLNAKSDGFRGMFRERREELVGSSIERRLLENEETLMMAGINRLPADKGPADINEEILDAVSPFRRPVGERMQHSHELRNELSKNNMLMPNEFVDWAVMEFVNRHKGWPRARLEFSMNRLLYYETQLHELGHCFGLRHMFGASADTKNYFDEYYAIEESIPLPDPRDYDTDGTNGLSPEEQASYRDAYDAAKKNRELAGMDLWMNSSVMEYTGQWYNRTVSQAGKYDDAAINFGYGDLVEVYDNEEGREMSQIHSANTDKVWARYYHGGQECTVGDDSTCPFSESGERSNLLLDTNRDIGLTQRCVDNPKADVDHPFADGVCTSTNEDLANIIEGETAPRWAPVDYRFCTDDRVGTIGWCHRFDEGDSYREIVRNTVEQYERQYIFTNFRRYRRTFNVGTPLNRMMSRQFNVLQDVFQNLLFNYANDPEFRTNTGDFGFYDQFMATADVVNFYGRVLGQPDVGAYEWNEAWERYERVNRDPDAPGAQLRMPLGAGRYLSTRYQDGLTGIQRIERVGSFYEKWITMQLMTQRGARQTYSRDVPFYTNYYDLFPVEMQQIFQGMIQDLPEAYMPRIQCATADDFPRCDDARVQYLNFYRGDCSSSETCRPDPAESFSGQPVIDGGGSTLLQALGVVFTLTEFPVFFDTTYQNQLFICVAGQGDCHRPSGDATEGEDFASYVSTRYGKEFLAWQVEPTEAVPNATSMGYEMVTEAKELSTIIEVLRRCRGDFDEDPPTDCPDAAETDVLDEIGYEYPDGTDGRTVTGEINRLDTRLRGLESFFFQIIQLERELGINTYLGFTE